MITKDDLICRHKQQIRWDRDEKNFLPEKYYKTFNDNFYICYLTGSRTSILVLAHKSYNGFRISITLELSDKMKLTCDELRK